MKLVILSFLFVSLQAFYFAEAAQIKWSFTGVNGPSQWKEHYPACKSKQQSPINIPVFKKEYNSSLKGSLKFTHYSCPCGGDFKMRNTGSTLKLYVTTAFATLTLQRKERYWLDQIHFHWGSDNTQGSEHRFDKERFPAEIHFVHYNIKYKQLLEAFNKPSGLAVLGVMVKIGKANPAFNNFLRHINEVRMAGQVHQFPAFDVETLLPSNTKNFYRYKGSLTTPPCFDHVTWTVFYTPIEISQEQIEKFRSLRDSEGKALVNNYRPVQDLNGRPVTSSFHIFLQD